MFLVLIEYIEDGGKDWSVVPHGKAGRRSVFSTREDAEAEAHRQAAKHTNRFAVVKFTSWFQQEVRKNIQETRVV